MQPTVYAIRSMSHFEPLCDLALQRYALDSNGRPLFAGELAISDVDFVVDLMDLYAGSASFHAERFKQYSLPTIIEYLERTHLFYEIRLIPKLEQAIDGINRLFPEHPISHVLHSFFVHYRNELFEHIELEEFHLFPYARRMFQGGAGKDYSVAEFKQVHNHEIEDSLDRVVHLIESDYPEVGRSFAYRAFKTLLDQFRIDLDIHHMIEEDVFLSMLEQREKECNGMSFQ